MDTTASVGSTPAVARERLRLDGFFHVEGVYHDMTEDDAEEVDTGKRICGELIASSLSLYLLEGQFMSERDSQ